MYGCLGDTLALGVGDTPGTEPPILFLLLPPLQGNPTVWEIADITSLSSTTFASVALPKPIIALSATSAGVFGLSFDAGVVEIIQLIV